MPLAVTSFRPCQTVELDIDLSEGILDFTKIDLVDLAHVGEFGELIEIISDAPQFTEKRFEILDEGDFFARCRRNQVVGTSQVTLNRYTGSVKTDKATGLASIFFEPNFYVISSIVLVLGGAGVAVYLKNKKNTVRKEKVK